MDEKNTSVTLVDEMYGLQTESNYVQVEVHVEDNHSPDMQWLENQLKDSQNKICHAKAPFFGHTKAPLLLPLLHKSCARTANCRSKSTCGDEVIDVPIEEIK